MDVLAGGRPLLHHLQHSIASSWDRLYSCKYLNFEYESNICPILCTHAHRWIGWHATPPQAHLPARVGAGCTYTCIGWHTTYTHAHTKCTSLQVCIHASTHSHSQRKWPTHSVWTVKGNILSMEFIQWTESWFYLFMWLLLHVTVYMQLRRNVLSLTTIMPHMGRINYFIYKITHDKMLYTCMHTYRYIHTQTQLSQLISSTFKWMIYAVKVPQLCCWNSSSPTVVLWNDKGSWQPRLYAG